MKKIILGIGGVLIISVMLWVLIGKRVEEGKLIKEGASKKETKGRAVKLQPLKPEQTPKSQITPKTETTQKVELKLVEEIKLPEDVSDVILDVETGRPKLLFYKGKEPRVRSISKIEVLDRSGKVIRALEIPEPTYTTGVAISDNGKFIGISPLRKGKRGFEMYNDKLEKLWEIEELPHDTIAPSYISPDGSYALTYGTDGVWILNKTGDVRKILAYPPAEPPGADIYFSKRGEYFAVYYGIMNVWPSQKVISIFNKNGEKIWEYKRAENKGGEVNFSPDLKYVVARISYDDPSNKNKRKSDLIAFDLITGEKTWASPITFITIPFYKFIFSEDSQLLLVYGYLRNIVYMVSTREGKILWEWRYPAENYSALRVYPTKDLRLITILGELFDPVSEKSIKGIITILDKDGREIYQREIPTNLLPHPGTINFPLPPYTIFTIFKNKKILLPLVLSGKYQKIEVKRRGGNNEK